MLHALSTREKQVFAELLKDARQSDREIARKLKMSQPSVSRIRQKLEKTGLIKRYAALPDISKCGLNLFAITFFEWKDHTKKEELNELVSFLSSHPNVILFGKGEGMSGRTTIILSIHSDYESFFEMIHQIRERWDTLITAMDHFLTTSKSVRKGGDVASAIVKMLRGSSHH